MQTVDIDLNCSASRTWTSIVAFSGIFDGNNKQIINVILNSSSNWLGLFGFINNAVLKNISISYIGTIGETDSNYVGGLVGWGMYSNLIQNCIVRNFQTSGNRSNYVGGIAGSFVGAIRDCAIIDSSFGVSGLNVGGIVALIQDGSTNTVGDNYARKDKGEVSGCSVINTQFTSVYAANGIAGVVSKSTNCEIKNNYVDADSQIVSSANSTSGIISAAYTSSILRNCFLGTINNSGKSGISAGIVGAPIGDCEVAENYFGGTLKATYNMSGLIGSIGYDSLEYYTINIHDNLVQGNLVGDSTSTYTGIARFTSTGSSYYTNITISSCLSNAEVQTSSTTYYPILNYSCGNYENNLYNKTLISAKSTLAYGGSQSTSYGLKMRSTYNNWTDFDKYWIISDKLNNGFPFLRSLLQYAPVTGFDGSGTKADPYQIKTMEDLQGMQLLYSSTTAISEYWWLLVNNIDISTDINGLTLNWTPIGYEGGVASGFNGHFNGNGKTISGLTITEQYENVGLFGKVASNATITNLNVTGTINWDQAKYVGGVVGVLDDGATLTNCSFTGTITGYLNSGNHAVVGGLAGKYSADTITGSANYDCYVYGTDNYTTFNRYNSTYAIV